MDFSQLKRNSGAEDLSKKVEKLGKGGKFNGDGDKFWNLTPDKAGNAVATIRFLPIAPMDAGKDALEWATVFRHSFQGNFGWFIEECPTTIEKECPVCEANKLLWATEEEGKRKIASDRKRQLKYISNIYVINDPGNPDNNGKVFLFKYGTKIFKKIQSAMDPDFEEEIAFDPFDLWTGANFKIKKTGIGRDTSYDESKFLNPGPLLTDDSKLEEIWKMEHSLKAFYDPSNFSTYENLKTRFQKVTGESGGQPQSGVAESVEEAIGGSMEAFKGYDTPSTPSNSNSGDENLDMDFFKTLGEEEVPF